MSTQTPPLPRKSAVVILNEGPPAPDHERAVHRNLAQRLATLLGARLVDASQISDVPMGQRYFLPTQTLINPVPYRAKGINTQDDFFGGLVEQPFMATKAISHSLPPGADAPQGWTTRFAELAGLALLDGFTVFSLTEARLAGSVMLQRAPLRLKPVRATGGRGQRVITSVNELDRALDRLDPGEVSVWGLVLEENLEEVQTYSVGQVSVAGLTASYFGTQHLVLDHMDDWVYGGSQLTVARGGYAQLLSLSMDEPTRLAIELAQRYEQAAIHTLPSFVASRRNYDIARGRNHQRQWRSGVLEQSWRMGGASGAEILALQALALNPDLQQLRASTHEVYDNVAVPGDAVLLYQGDDKEVGLISKYARIQNYEHSK